MSANNEDDARTIRIARFLITAMHFMSSISDDDISKLLDSLSSEVDVVRSVMRDDKEVVEAVERLAYAVNELCRLIPLIRSSVLSSSVVRRIEATIGGRDRFGADEEYIM